jgi:hypothetical protein
MTRFGLETAAPCISRSSQHRRKAGGAVADESPIAPRGKNPAAEPGAPFVGFFSSNSRQGRPDRKTRA